MTNYILVIILILVIIYAVWKPGERFSARGASLAQRNIQINYPVGAAGVSTLGQARTIGKIRGAYGVPRRTLQTQHPLAHMRTPAVNAVEIPLQPFGGFSPFA